MNSLEAEGVESRDDTDRLDRSCCRFQVGRDEINMIFVEASLWTGIRTYSTNAAGESTPVMRGPCRFEVGERERHQVEIQVDRNVRVNAFVDGGLVQRNLFPRLRQVIFGVVAVFVVVCFLASVTARLMIGV